MSSCFTGAGRFVNSQREYHNAQLSYALQAQADSSTVNESTTTRIYHMKLSSCDFLLTPHCSDAWAALSFLPLTMCSRAILVGGCRLGLRKAAGLLATACRCGEVVIEVICLAERVDVEVIRVALGVISALLMLQGCLHGLHQTMQVIAVPVVHAW